MCHTPHAWLDRPVHSIVTICIVYKSKQTDAIKIWTGIALSQEIATYV